MSKTILLADDSVTIQKVVELTFMDQDYKVVAVGNGDAALAQIVETNPDLLIADVHMPGADGYEVCRRAKEAQPSLPVLLLVGTFEPFDEQQAAAVGSDGHLKKPFDSQDLLARVEALIGEAPPAAARAPAAAPAAPPPPFPEAVPPAVEPPAGVVELEPPALTREEIPVDPGPAPEVAADPGFQPIGAGPPAGGAADPASPFPLPAEPPAAGLVLPELSLPEQVPAAEPEVREALFTGAEDTSPVTLPEDFQSFQAPAEPAAAPVEEPSSFSFATELSTVPEPASEPWAVAPSSAADALSRTEVEETRPMAAKEPVDEPPLPDLDGSDLEVTPDAAPEPVVDPEPALAVEEGPPSEEVAAAPAEVPPAAAPPSAPAADNGHGALSEGDVDRIARRVVELMGDKALREVAWEVVPDLAELIIKERIRELEGQVE